MKCSDRRGRAGASKALLHYSTAMSCAGSVGDQSATVRPSRGCTPARRHFGERQQHEAAQMRAGMRQHRVRRVAHQVAHGDDVEVERARRVRTPRTRPARASIACSRASSQAGSTSPSSRGDAVHVVRLAGGRQGRRTVPARHAEQAQAGQRRKSRPPPGGRSASGCLAAAGRAGWRPSATKFMTRTMDQRGDEAHDANIMHGFIFRQAGVSTIRTGHRDLRIARLAAIKGFPPCMHFLPDERTALFIDGANLYSASRNLGFDVDYRNLLEYFRKKTHVIRAYYYSAVLETEEYSPLKPLTDWLAYNGYTLVTKPAHEFTDATGRRRVKGNMDIELAIDMLELRRQDRPRRAVQRRFRLPPAGRGGAAARRAGLGGVLDPHQPADGGRRAAPPGRPVPGTGRDRARVHPPPDGAARPARHRRAPDPGRALSPIRPTRCSDAAITLRTARRRQPRSRRPGRAPPRDCALCPRLVAYRAANRAANPDWFNAPVPSFGPLDARLLVVGMAPGVKGANRTGRPFTGDHAGHAALRDAAAIRPRHGRLSAPSPMTA